MADVKMGRGRHVVVAVVMAVGMRVINEAQSKLFISIISLHPHCEELSLACTQLAFQQPSWQQLCKADDIFLI